MGRVLRKGTRDRTSPERCVRSTLEAEAMRLRRDGYAFAEIAEMLNITGEHPENKARYLVETGLSRITRPAADSLRDELEDRLDKLFNRSLRIAKTDAPDRVAAINAAVNVANRLAALRGLDAPKQVDLKDERQAPPDAAARKKFLERLAAEAREEEAGGGGEGSGGATGDEAPT